jgi:hypothetical protein
MRLTVLLTLTLAFSPYTVQAQTLNNTSSKQTQQTARPKQPPINRGTGRREHRGSGSVRNVWIQAPNIRLENRCDEV